MKKKILVLILLVVIFIPIFNYSYPWKLNNRFPHTKFIKLKVYEMFSKKNHTINDEKRVNQLYEYLSKQRGRKYAEWFLGGLHGLSQGDGNYNLSFISEKESSEFIDLIISNSKGYLNFTDGSYCLDSKAFSIKKFIEFIR